MITLFCWFSAFVYICTCLYRLFLHSVSTRPSLDWSHSAHSWPFVGWDSAPAVSVVPLLLLSIIFYLIVLASTFSVLASGRTLVSITLWLLCWGLLSYLPTLISLSLSPSCTLLVFSTTFDLGPLFSLFPRLISLLFTLLCACLLIVVSFPFWEIVHR